MGTLNSAPASDPHIERRAAALKALQHAALVMASELEPEQLLKRVTDIAIEVLDASSGSLLMWDPEKSTLCFRVTSSDAQPELVGATMPADVGIAGWVFTHREPTIVADVRKDERFYSKIDESLGRQTTSLIAAPLMTQQEVLGVIELVDKRSRKTFDELDLDILTTLASQAAVSIDNARLSSRLHAQRERLITIEREIHKKLARDLHDGPAQWLAGMSMNIEYILRLMDVDLAKAKVEMEAVRGTLNKTIQQIRNLMFELRPVLLTSQGLKPALQHYIESLNETESMNIRLRMDDLRTRLSADTERAVFDIVREALSNVKRHAHTQEVWVDFLCDPADRLIVTVKDNGLGFDLNAVQREYPMRGSLGMLNMLERADAVGGDLTLESVPGYGTTVKLTIPLAQKPVEKTDQTPPDNNDGTPETDK
jgi:signal transduction histidine kinase